MNGLWGSSMSKVETNPIQEFKITYALRFDDYCHTLTNEQIMEFICADIIHSAMLILEEGKNSGVMFDTNHLDNNKNETVHGLASVTIKRYDNLTKDF